MLYAVTKGDQGSADRSNRVEFIQYDKITVKMSWLFFAKNLKSSCDALKMINFFGDLKTL